LIEVALTRSSPTAEIARVGAHYAVKLIQGQWFWYQSKAGTVCDFPLVNNTNLRSISRRLLRIIGQIFAFEIQGLPFLTPSFAVTP